ncbi:hypothetical protein V500_01936 [Pseudogymnoascus sp. VKM F-4518 (FW-2643)]|nr:hypothetical protein V500_01936 [Pseudogymnoascus sp. VKM F-4518 (FW-2643)]
MFDESSLDIKIISAFEGRPSRLSKTRWMSLKKTIHVSKSLARTNSKRETLIEVDATHTELCNLTKGSAFYKKLQESLEITKHFTPRHNTSTPSNIGPPQSLLSWSVVDPNEPKLTVSSLHQSSGEGASNVNAQASSSDRSAWDIIPDQPVLGEVKTVTLPCYMLKHVTQLLEFCGRDKIMNALEAHLIPRNQVSSVGPSPSLLSYALCGTGGLGKTQIAIEFAYASMQRKDFDAIFWVAASNEGNLAKSFSDIAVGLGLENLSNHREQVVSRDLVLESLSHPVRRILDGAKLPPDVDFPSLLIFDNADNLQTLQGYWPLAGKGSILVTSRDPMAKGKMYIPCDTGIILPPFEVSDAAGLLRSITGYNRPEDKEPSEQVVERLSCFPMAVVPSRVRRCCENAISCMAVQYHIERGNLTQAPEFLDSSRKVCESVGDESKITNADVSYCRAELASMNGKPEVALPFALENLKLISKHDLKGWRYPQAHNCLAAVYLGTGDFEKAAVHADLAIRGYATLETPEFVDFPHINKAYGLMLTNRHEGASKVLENYLKGELVERGKEGTESFKTACAKSLLGAIYRDLGRYEDSRKMLDTTLVQFRDTVGETNVRMANTYESLGDTHGKLCNFAIARDMYLKALEVFTVNEDSVPEISRVYFKLSRAYGRLDSVEEAQKAREDAQKLLDTLGTDLTEKDINSFLPASARTKIE